jgi:hypothetical protein
VYPIEYSAISLLKKKLTTKYQMLSTPVLWNRVNDLEIHIDVPMHLLFLGITKSIVRMLQARCALRGSTHDFTKHVVGVMETFNGLGLSWLVYFPYTGAKLGGWISENYLALAWLMCWFYSKLSTVVTDYDFFQPRTPQKDWTMKQNMGCINIKCKGSLCSCVKVHEPIWWPPYN